MPIQYYRNRDKMTTYVWYKLLDRDGRMLVDYSNRACFADITYRQMHKDTATILIWHDKESLPYDVPEIERWINDLNEMDFPCSYIGMDKDGFNHNFQINVSDYSYKVHLMGTLMLLRCLFEAGICRVPEIYFQMMDANPQADKFEVLQNAHKAPRPKDGFFGIGNIGHMVTYDGNGKNVTKEHVFNEYKRCGLKPHDKSSAQQSYKWNGGRDA